MPYFFLPATRLIKYKLVAYDTRRKRGFEYNAGARGEKKEKSSWILKLNK